MDRHVASVTLLEPFDLGKNTALNAGLEIKIYGKGSPKKRGPQIGTIRIGQGSFAWWAKSKKVEMKTGKGKPNVRLGWSQFAEHMQEIESKKSQKRKAQRPTHAKAVADVMKALRG